MHTTELLEEALAAAESLGYGVRNEWLGGSGGGRCEVSGRKWIFIDLALSVSEQFDQLAEALRDDPGLYTLAISQPLSRMLGLRRSA
jgi:hypothetical protein